MSLDHEFLNLQFEGSYHMDGVVFKCEVRSPNGEAEQ